MCRSMRTIRPTGCATSSTTPGRPWSSRICVSPTSSRALATPTLTLDGARGDIAGFDDAPLSEAEKAGRGAGPLLRALHLGHDRQSQGRRDRPSEHLQFRPRRRRNLWLPPRRPGLPGHVDRLRLLDRGSVGPARRRRDARSERLGDEPVRRGARRLPRVPRRHLLRLRADPARLDRSRSAPAARLPDRRRGLPAGAGQALEPPGPHAAQQLRADRDDRHRDARRARSGRDPSPSASPCRPIRSSSSTRSRTCAVVRGEPGEIGIAGVGVAEGYLNRPELTEKKFIRDFLALPNNPSGRIYRTGDLGRLTEDGEIEYLGRIDTQIKLRGYRIELTEIESVLIEIPEIAQAVAATFEPEPGATELVAYYSVKHGAAAPDPASIVAHMRARLPAYMTPAYLERLPFIPTLVSNKADRKLLPAPKSARLRLNDKVVPPETETERDALPRRSRACWASRRYRSTPTSSPNTARTRSSWRASARASASSTRRCRSPCATSTPTRRSAGLPARSTPRGRPRRKSSTSVPRIVRRTSPITPAARRRRRFMRSSAPSRSPPSRPRSTGSTRPSTRRSRSTAARSRSRSCGSSATTPSPSSASGCSSAARARGRFRSGARATSASGRPRPSCAPRPPWPSPARRSTISICGCSARRSAPTR